MSIRTWKLIALGITALLLIAAVFYFVLKIVGGLGSEILAISATILGSVIIASLTHYFSESAKRKEAHREKKVQIYEEFIALVRDSMKQEKLTSRRPNQDKIIISKIEKINDNILLYASPGVIRAYSDFRAPSENDRPHHILLIANELFREIRKDIGLSNFGISHAELINLYLVQDDQIKPNNTK